MKLISSDFPRRRTRAGCLRWRSSGCQPSGVASPCPVASASQSSGPALAADVAICKVFNANIGDGGEQEIAQALQAAGTSVSYTEPSSLSLTSRARGATLLNADLKLFGAL
jgi:hypothetical protein